MLKYNISGEGKPVVLIHGFCESKKLWDAYTALLSTQYQVVSVDLPGFGESAMGEVHTIDSMARDIKATLDTLQLGRTVLVGHSLGGYVSLAFAELFSERLLGLSLFHSTSFSDSKEKKENRDKAIAFVEKYGGKRYVESLFPGLFAEEKQEQLREHITYAVREAAKTPQASIIRTLEAMRDRPDRSALLGRLPFPIQFIVGKQDVAVPLEQSLRECYLPREAHVQIMENIGHMGMVEDKPRTLRVLQDFLAYCFRREEG